MDLTARDAPKTEGVEGVEGRVLSVTIRSTTRIVRVKRYPPTPHLRVTSCYMVRHVPGAQPLGMQFLVASRSLKNILRSPHLRKEQTDSFAKSAHCNANLNHQPTLEVQKVVSKKTKKGGPVPANQLQLKLSVTVRGCDSPTFSCKVTSVVS